MMPPKPVAAPSGLHLHCCLSALPRLAKAGEIERVNAQFARVELVKQFRIIDRALTPEDEEITPTMKLKRKFVHQKFSEALLDIRVLICGAAGNFLAAGGLVAILVRSRSGSGLAVMP
jgi:hypothetical protein